MKKRILLLMIFILLSLTSCKKEFTNEITTRTINYEDNITVYDLEDAMVTAIEKGEQSVIGVESSSPLSTTFGSGVIIKKIANKDAFTYYVVTNAHVISTSTKINRKIEVYLGTYQERINAQHLEHDFDLDIAIISFTSNRELSVATIGDSTTYKKGRFAIAIGSPYDLETFYDSASIGNVSDPNRLCEEESGKLNFYIQHTAPINSGNSGGGLFDLYGNLMGINTWKYSETDIEGMGFAIPIHIVKNKYGKYF